MRGSAAGTAAAAAIEHASASPTDLDFIVRM
jgi:hypothetical protein